MVRRRRPAKARCRPISDHHANCRLGNAIAPRLGAARPRNQKSDPGSDNEFDVTKRSTCAERHLVVACAAFMAAMLAVPAAAQEVAKATETPSARVSCESPSGGRTHCPADTSSGVALVKSEGEAPCLLGKTWGYDDTGIWVADGCSAE